MNVMHRVALVAGVALACSDDGTGPSCASGGTATAVRVCDNFFAPASSPIATGAGITWTWGGGNTHNVTFEDAGFTNSTTKTSGTHAQAFANAGTFRYRCTIHSSNFNSGMVGSVTVQ
ncbi:MAG: cupredoxin domain-containing protein [Gemmatimonadales bacterium]